MDTDERFEKIETNIVEINKHMAEQDQRMDKMEASSEKFFSKMLKKFDALEGKLGKMMKWVYRLLAIIIALLIIIAIKAPSTATEILTSAGTVIKAL